MSVYGELLRMALEAESDALDRPLAELVALAIRRKGTLDTSAATTASEGDASRLDAAAVIGDVLSYDAVLVKLCERLGVAQELTGRQAGPSARGRAEERLAERLPALAVLLGDPGTSRPEHRPGTGRPTSSPTGPRA